MYRININIPVGMWVWKAVKKGRVCFRSMNLSQNTTERVSNITVILTSLNSLEQNLKPII